MKLLVVCFVCLLSVLFPTAVVMGQGEIVNHPITLPVGGATFAPMWWLTISEFIIGCSTSGILSICLFLFLLLVFNIFFPGFFPTNPTCSFLNHQITIGSGTIGSSGYVTVLVTDGGVSFFTSYTSMHLLFNLFVCLLMIGIFI